MESGYLAGYFLVQESYLGGLFSSAQFASATLLTASRGCATLRTTKQVLSQGNPKSPSRPGCVLTSRWFQAQEGNDGIVLVENAAHSPHRKGMDRTSYQQAKPCAAGQSPH